MTFFSSLKSLKTMAYNEATKVINGKCNTEGNKFKIIKSENKHPINPEHNNFVKLVLAALKIKNNSFTK